MARRSSGSYTKAGRFYFSGLVLARLEAGVTGKLVVTPER